MPLGRVDGVSPSDVHSRCYNSTQHRDTDDGQASGVVDVRMWRPQVCLMRLGFWIDGGEAACCGEQASSWTFSGHFGHFFFLFFVLLCYGLQTILDVFLFLFLMDILDATMRFLLRTAYDIGRSSFPPCSHFSLRHRHFYIPFPYHTRRFLYSSPFLITATDYIQYFVLHFFVCNHSPLSANLFSLFHRIPPRADWMCRP